MKLDKRTALALTNLRTNNDFGIFLNALGDYSEEVMKLLVFVEDKKFRQVQGKAQCLSEIFKAIDGAAKRLEAFKQAKGDNAQI